MRNFNFTAPVPASPSAALMGYARRLAGDGNNTHILGSGIVLGAGVGYPNSLHINGLWANGIPNWPAAGATVGTIFALPAGTPAPAGSRPLYIL